MKKNKFQKLSGNDLDKLLNRTFLDLDLGETGNEVLLESISKHTLVKQSPAALMATEFFYNKIFFAVSILSFAGSFFSWLHTPSLNTTVQNNTQQTILTKQTQSHPLADEPVKRTLEDKSAFGKNSSAKNVPDSLIKNKPAPLSAPAITDARNETSPLTDQAGAERPVPIDETTAVKEQAKEPGQKTPVSTVIPEAYIFPNLTQKQRKENENEKKWMAKFVSRLKQDKGIEKYVRIPALPDKSIKEFYMASGEVTNLSYRTFLFDLLLNDRKEEFLIAKPNQSLWINAAGVHLFDTLSTIYFSDHNYDDYPVVNISVVGAELYCEWLTAIANQVREKEGKPSIRIRLPSEKEWLYAANVGHSNAVYPWFTDSIQNNKNRFLANFCIKKQADRFKQPIAYPNGFNPDAYTAAGMASNNIRTATFLAWSYEPNDFQLYNICGNVSEMVYSDAKQLKAKGGNWNSDFEQLKLNRSDEYNPDGVKPSPMLGFRVCVVEVK